MRLMEVVCRCGWSVRGSEREVIARTRAHAQTEHQLVMTARDVKAIWRLVDESTAAGNAAPT
jgi:predicted small metal-binding protein